MRLKGKRKNWVSERIITEDQSTRIAAFERQALIQKFFNSLKYTAYLAVLLGISLIIAANWQNFGMYFKLYAHIGVNTALAVFIWMFRDSEKYAGWREMAVYFLCGLTLTLLALIGQTFQLQGSLSGLMTTWFILISGMVILIGRNPRTASLWALSAFAVLCMNLESLYDIEPASIGMAAIISIFTTGILLIYAFARSQWLVKINPEISDKLALLCGLIAIGVAMFASLSFHESDLFDWRADIHSYELILAGLAVLFGVTAYFVKKLNPANDLVYVFIASGVFIFVACYIPLESDLLSAFHFMGFMITLAFIAAKGDHDVLLSLSMFAVSARLFILFLELFGSLLVTGFGLIIAGGLLLVMIRLTLMFNQKIRLMIHEK